MKNRIKSIAFLILFVLIICITTVVRADTATFSLSSNSSQFKVGDTIVVTLKASNIDSSTGLAGITGKIEYDKEIFETVDNSSLELLNSWASVGGDAINSDTGVFVILRADGQKNPGDILKIKLKVKKELTAESTPVTVKIDDLCAEDIDADVTATVANVTVTLTKSAAVDPTPTPTPTPSTTPSTTPTPTKTTTTPTTLSASTGKLPQTGEETVYIVIGMMMLVVISTVSFIRYKNIKLK